MASKTGEVEAVGSRNDGEFGILLDDDNWYNGNGDKPDLNQGDEVTLEFDLTMNDGDEERWLVDDHDSIEVESRASGNSGTGGGSGTAGTKDDRAVSRQSAAKTVGNMFQGSEPDGAEDLLRRYRMIEDIAHFNIRGEWPERVEKGNLAVEDGAIPDDVEEKLEELSDRLGQIEEAGGPEAASTDEVAELEEEVSDIANQVENLQAGLKKMKQGQEEEPEETSGEPQEDSEEDDEEKEAIFDDEGEEEEGEDEDE